MKLDKKPNIDRYWVSSQNAVQLSCEYRSLNRREFSWEHSGGDINNRHFQITRDIKKSDGAVFVTSSIRKPYVDATDSGNYTCRIGEMSRSWEVNVLSGKYCGPVVVDIIVIFQFKVALGVSPQFFLPFEPEYLIIINMLKLNNFPK